MSVCCFGVSESETGSSGIRRITFDGQKGLIPAPENAERIFEDEDARVRARTYAVNHSAFEYEGSLYE